MMRQEGLSANFGMSIRNELLLADFPLSQAFKTCRGAEDFRLTSNHLQLAAQVPAEWIKTENTLRDARFALRKIVWRAMLEETLAERSEVRTNDEATPVPCGDAGAHTDRPARRLGRLNDSAYKDWETFVRTVRNKMDLTDCDIREPDPAMQKRIEVFHTMRCIAGPAVESLILLDRLAWLQEKLQVSGPPQYRR